MGKAKGQAEVTIPEGDTRTVTVTGDSVRDVLDQLKALGKNGQNEVRDARIVG